MYIYRPSDEFGNALCADANLGRKRGENSDIELPSPESPPHTSSQDRENIGKPYQRITAAAHGVARVSLY